MHDISKGPWAALFTYCSEEVFTYRRIVFGKSPNSYVYTISDELSRAVAPLVEHHAEYVNSAEMETFHESWCQEEYPEDGWNFENVLEILRGIPGTALEEYQRTGSPSILNSWWYTTLFEFVNEAFPHEDGVRMDFEGPMGPFLSELLRFESETYRSIEKLTDHGALCLGKLAVLAQLAWTGEVPREQWRAVGDLFEGFNEHNAGS